MPLFQTSRIHSRIQGQLSKIWEVSCDWWVFRKGISYSVEQTLVGGNKSPQDVCEGGYPFPFLSFHLAFVYAYAIPFSPSQFSTFPDLTFSFCCPYLRNLVLSFHSLSFFPSFSRSQSFLSTCLIDFPFNPIAL